MIIEYIREATDILYDKVDSGEITLEAAYDAYEDIMEKALDEMSESIIESVNDDVLTVEEAILIAEMSGIIEPGDVYIEAEALYDLSGLSEDEKKKIKERLDSYTPSQRKKAEKALAEKFPNKKAIEEKKAKKKEMLKKAGIAAGVAAGVGLTAYGVKKGVDKKRAKEKFINNYNVERRSINKSNPDYEPILNKHDSDMENLKKDRERDLKDIDQLLPSEQREKYAKWDQKEKELNDRRDKEIAEKRAKLISAAGSEEEYYNKLHGRDAAITRAKMLADEDKRQVEAQNQENIDYAKAHRARSFFNGLKNAAGNTAIGKKLGLRNDYRTYGVTDKQINKKFGKDTKDKQNAIDKQTDKTVRSINRGDRDNEIPDFSENKPKKKKGLFGKKK